MSLSSVTVMEIVVTALGSVSKPFLLFCMASNNNSNLYKGCGHNNKPINRLICMPVPTPNENESEDAFVSRCIHVVSNEPDNKRLHNQIVAICENQWREAKKACPTCTGVLACPTHERQQPLLTDIIKRLESVKDFIVGKFGEAGRAVYEQTLVRLGVYDAKTMKFNCNLLKSDLALPFVKLGEGSFEIHNVILSEGKFTKIDDVEHTVAAYANTIVSDCVDDIVLPESYKDSANAYNKPIFFMHHLDVTAGDFLGGVVDEIGWLVKSRPKPTFWSLIKDGTIKGYSIGGWFAGTGQQIGKAIVWSYDVRINDVSYVTNPCNKLSFFSLLKSKSSMMAVSKNEIIVACNGEIIAKEKIKEEKKKMTEKQIEATTNPQATEKKLEDMKNEEIVGYIKAQAGKEERARLLKIAQATDEELKAHEEDTRIVEINRTLGVLTAKLDGVIKSIAELGVKFAGAEVRLVKMEELPSLKPTGVATGDEEFDKAIENATSFDQVDALVRAKTSKVNPQ